MDIKNNTHLTVLSKECNFQVCVHQNLLLHLSGVDQEAQSRAVLFILNLPEILSRWLIPVW